MPKRVSKERLKRIKELAEDVVDGWDMDTLIEYAMDRMADYFLSLNKKDFDEEWNDYYCIEEK